MPGSSRLDRGERPRYPLPISRLLPISFRLRLGTGQRVKDTQPQQRQEMIEFNHVPEEALIDFVRITGT